MPTLHHPLSLAFLGALFLCGASAAHGHWPQSLDAGSMTEPVPLMGHVRQSLRTSRDTRQPMARDVRNRTYQLGDDWGKVPVTDGLLREAPDALRRAALATATAGGATSFVLGQFDGQVVMATNHHVFAEASQCLKKAIRFAALGASGTCSRFLGTWDEVDLSLFVIDVDNSQERARILEVAANFDFDAPIRQGQELLTVGFGIANNPARRMVANGDSDCKVFSPTQDFRLMPDPDALNPGTYDAWSFANGCDVSHGDSGSAMVDRKTGRPVGLIWTGKIPKSPQVQSSRYLAELAAGQSEEIWTELSYAVPASKIKEVLLSALSEGSVSPEDSALLAKVVGLEIER
jgi:hypothetical protein